MSAGTVVALPAALPAEHRGVELAKDPDKLTVLDVINASHPIQRIETCPLGIPSHGTSLCRMHRKLDNAIAQVEKTLASSTIQEMVEPRSGGKCALPAFSARRPTKPAR